MPLASALALYAPPDVEDAYAAWGASCGPCACAAVLARPLGHLQPLFPGIAARRYVNPTHMQDALRQAGILWRRCDAHEREALQLDYGLAFLCFTGPWTQPGVPVAASYARSHWIGVATTADAGRMVYDINASTRWCPHGAWVPWAWWTDEILPRLVAVHRKADGGYLVRWACDILAERAQ